MSINPPTKIMENIVGYGSNMFRKAKAAYSLGTTLAMEYGLLKPHYERFIILTSGRTGSTMLIDCLSQHPNIEMFYEVFHAEAETGRRRRHTMLLEEPVKYVNRYVFRYYPRKIKSVGFSIHYYHCQNENQKQVWDYLKESRIKVLHLKRNPLRVYISMLLAKKSGVYHITEENQREYLNNLKIEIKYDEMLDFLEVHSTQTEYNDFHFSQTNKIDVWYENLVADLDGELGRIQTWLGVEPHIFYPKRKKQMTQPVSQIVGNFQELKEKFQNTKWSEYFKELEANDFAGKTNA